MRKLIFLLPLLLLSCEPERSGEIVRLDIYCNSCHVKVINKAKPENEWFSETIFDGQVTNYKSLSIQRFRSDFLRCTQVTEFSYANNDTLIFVVIENGDTLNENPEDGTCF